MSQFIDSLIDMLSGMDPEKITVHEERCVCVRNRHANCLKCAEVCTTGAIEYTANCLTVHPEKCIGCGTCANACPTCALEVAGLNDDDLTRGVKQSIRATKGHPVLACQNALDAAKEELEAAAPQRRGLFFRSAQEQAGFDENALCIVPCLGRIDESLLVGIAAYRAFDATLVCHDCEHCEHAKGGTFLQDVVAAGARNLLDAFDQDMPINVTTQFPERVKLAPGQQGSSQFSAMDEGGVSRADMFRSVKQGSQALVGAGIDDVLGEPEPEKPVPVAYRKVNERTGTLSHFLPTRRTRMYNYLNRFGEPVVDQVETRIVGQLQIDPEKCNSCRMCANFCPTAAISKIDETDDGEELFGVLHRPSLCVQCRLCESLCRPGAITISSTIPIGQFTGKKALVYEMKKPTWEPNRPDSIFNKIHEVIGSDLQMHAF